MPPTTLLQQACRLLSPHRALQTVPVSWQSLAEGVLEGNRRALSKAITLVESRREVDVKDGRNLLSHLLRMRAPSNTGRTIPTSRRIAVSGPPGVGKSTWLEAVGMRLVSDGHKVAILAIDPSSPVTGGSLLGDRTRMPQLSNHPSCYIRPSPSGGSMGGVAQRTMEVIHLVEAAGYGYLYI